MVWMNLTRVEPLKKAQTLALTCKHCVRDRCHCHYMVINARQFLKNIFRFFFGLNEVSGVAAKRKKSTVEQEKYDQNNHIWFSNVVCVWDAHNFICCSQSATDLEDSRTPGEKNTHREQQLSETPMCSRCSNLLTQGIIKRSLGEKLSSYGDLKMQRAQ